MGATSAGDYPDVTGYKAARREQTGGPAPGFVMHGETFIAEPVLRASSLLDFAERAAAMPVLGDLGFLRDQLLPESWERFDVLFQDRQRPVDDGMLERAREQLMKQYTGRPTKESSSSASTRSKRGAKSKGGSSSAGSELRSA